MGKRLGGEGGDSWGVPQPTSPPQAVLQLTPNCIPPRGVWSERCRWEGGHQRVPPTLNSRGDLDPLNVNSRPEVWMEGLTSPPLGAGVRGCNSPLGVTSEGSVSRADPS